MQSQGFNAGESSTQGGMMHHQAPYLRQQMQTLRPNDREQGAMMQHYFGGLQYQQGFTIGESSTQGASMQHQSQGFSIGDSSTQGGGMMQHQNQGFTIGDSSTQGGMMRHQDSGYPSLYQQLQSLSSKF